MPPSRRDHSLASEQLFDYPPPIDANIERIVLGGILTEGGEAFDKVQAVISASDFGLEKHKRIFARMAEVHERGEPIDRVTLTGELIKQGQLESVDGLSYLIDLDASPAVENLAHYAERILDLSRRRRAMALAQEILAQATDERIVMADLASRASEQLQVLQSGTMRNEGRSPAEVVENFPGGISAFLDPLQQPQGIPTGFWALDRLMAGGIRKGELAVIAARPSQGKSAMAAGIAMHAALKQRVPVDIYNLEMSNSSILSRMMCSHARIDSHKFKLGFLGAEERQRLQRALFEITEAPLRMFDEFHGLDQISSSIKHRAKEPDAPGLVIVDYLQLIRISGKRRVENENAELTEISRDMKLNAKFQALYLVSQLSRASEKRTGDGRRPQLSDLRGSGAIEQDCDIAAFIHRPEFYSPHDESLRGRAEILIPKYRNGPTGELELLWIKSLVKFENRAEDFHGEAPPEQEEPYEGGHEF